MGENANCLHSLSKAKQRRAKAKPWETTDNLRKEKKMKESVTEPVKAEPSVEVKVGAKVVPSEGWLAKHRERMNCARPVAKPEPKTGGKPEGKPPVVVKPKEAQGMEGQALGLGDGWGW
jgi:hypothetical protein